MKLKLTIPAQSLRIEIPAQEIEVDFELVPEVPPVIPPIEPPIEPEPPIIPPIDVNEVFNLDEYLKGKEGLVRMPERMPTNKEVLFRSNGMIKPEKATALIGNNILVTESWDKTPTQLINLSGCREFGIVGIAFVTPPNRPIVTGFPDKEVFGWDRDTVSEGKFAWINAPEITDKERVTYGLCRFGYSSNSEGKIHLIGKNLSHNGFNFTQIKNPYRGNLWLTLQNINVHNPIIEFPQSHYYSPTKIPVKIRVQDGIAKIISNNTFDQILTWMGYNKENQRSILYFGKYVYDIRDQVLIDKKTLVIDREDEYNPGDNIAGSGRVIQKQIDESRRTNWVYSFEANDLPTKKTLPQGEFDAFICYKGNSLFSNGHLNSNTVFPEHEITSSQGYGWSWYNEEFSGYIENFHGSGYFRNSGGSGITGGLTIRNSTFEKNGPIDTSNNDMPQEAKEYIQYLESL